ncbi:hypothetical protein D1B31_09150 [Neobacillus notoginsengisoli]|uniref:SHOCT domain-containing protein n=1 Tax=Neobacillus notoginsengisoli TaxID=1578198 RepID=A0A417YV08_9BACI|nr:hypothetical protein [Neobacillus notoginsengisoli]RHW41099.1 hypothetical protein D1B31_09150 [Neobacillus notoginsengisoli]
MLKKLLSFLLIASFGFSLNASGASAEEKFMAEQFPYKEMQIQVMPEFDYPENWPKEEPSLLVGLYGTITNKTGEDYSGKVEIPVPTDEKNFQIYLVAEFPAADKPEVQRPFEVNKEQGTVSFTPEKPIKKDATYSFVVEYYSNPIEVSEKTKKEFTYEYIAAAEIDTLDVIIYAPLKSTEIAMDPKPSSTQKSEYGEQIAFYQQKTAKIGDSFKYNVSYKKEGNASTLSMIDTTKKPNDENHNGTTATDQVTGGDEGNTSGTSDRPIIGAAGGVIIGVSIIIAGMFVFFGLRNKADKRKNPAPGKKAASGKQADKKQKKTGSNAEEIKELRKKLLSGKIDQEAYDEQVKKLI